MPGTSVVHHKSTDVTAASAEAPDNQKTDGVEKEPPTDQFPPGVDSDAEENDKRKKKKKKKSKPKPKRRLSLRKTRAMSRKEKEKAAEEEKSKEPEGGNKEEVKAADDATASNG